MAGGDDVPPENPTVEEAKHWLLDRERREGWSLFLNEWTTMVLPGNETARSMVEHSVTYGSTAVQAAFVLNGGALAALPPLSQAIASGPHAPVAHDAMIFVIGIAAAAVCSLAAYLNFQWQAQVFWYDSNQSAIRIIRQYGMPATETRDAWKRKLYAILINVTLGVGLLSAAVSFVAFVCGVYSFLKMVAP